MVIFSPSFFTAGRVGSQERKKKEKKKETNVEGRLVRDLSSKELLFESWQQASRLQMVFEKKPAAGRGAHSWMNAAFRSCENLFYPTTRRRGIIRKDGFRIKPSEPELTDQSEQRLTHKECENVLNDTKRRHPRSVFPW